MTTLQKNIVLNNYNSIGSDSLRITFNSTELDLLGEEIARRESNTTLLKNQSVKFYTRKEVEENGFTLDSEFAYENEIFVVLSNNNSVAYPVGEGAWLSLKQRIEIFGKGLLELEDTILRDVLNSRTNKQKYQVLLIDDKVRGMFTNSNRGYKYISQEELLTVCYDAACKRFGDVAFYYGEVTYDYSIFKFMIKDNTQSLTDIYGKEEDFTPGLMLKTSDTGYQATEIIPIWRINGVVCPEDYEGLKLVHRGFGNEDYDKIRDCMPNIFVRMRNTLELIKAQMQIEIVKPIKTFNSVCKYLGIPKKYTNELKECLSLYLHNNSKVTGYDLTKVVVNYSSTKEEEERKKMEVYAGMFLNVDYSKHI